MRYAILVLIIAALVFTVLNASDRRGQEPFSQPVATVVSTTTFAAERSTAIADANYLNNINGICEQIKVKTYDDANAITWTVAISDSTGASYFSKASIAEDANTLYKATSDATDFDAFLVDDTMTVTLTPSGKCDDTGGDVVVTLFLR